MARDAALVVSWTRAVPGREARPLEAFREALEWWDKQAAAAAAGCRVRSVLAMPPGWSSSRAAQTCCMR